jgi:hypothetical protein
MTEHANDQAYHAAQVERLILFRALCYKAVNDAFDQFGMTPCAADQEIVATALIDIVAEITALCTQPSRGQFIERLQTLYAQRTAAIAEQFEREKGDA